MPDFDGTEWSRNAGIRSSKPVLRAAVEDAMDRIVCRRETKPGDWNQYYTPDPSSGVGTIHYERHGTYSEYITLAEAQRRGIHS